MTQYMALAEVDFEPINDGGLVFEGSALEGMAWVMLRMTKQQLVSFIASQPADATMELIGAIGEAMRTATGPVAEMFKQAFARLAVAGFASCKLECAA